MYKRFALSRVKIDDRDFIITYDLEAGCSIPVLTDYGLYATTVLQFSRLTLDKRMGQLLEFWDFLQREEQSMELLSDSILRRYRDIELERVRMSEISRGDELVAKRTVNDKLSSIYGLLKWMQDSGRLSHCEVTLPAGRKTSFRDHSALKQSLGRPTVSYRRTGAGGAHSGFAATEKVYDAVAGSFFHGQDLYAAQRNALILAIANAVGFRRASIASLCTEQFDRRVLERAADSIVRVRPSSQKFAYAYEFAFPVWLALRICDYCDAYRTPLVERKNADNARTQDRLFLSTRDARPLTERAITQIFSKAMREAGAPKGTSIHSFRAKFANDQIAEELELRARRGMDTSSSAVAAAVAMKMGHRNASSLYAYVASAQTAQALRERTAKASHVDMLRQRLQVLEEENRLLRQTDQDN